MKNCTLLATAIIILCILAAGCTRPAVQPPVQVPATTETVITPPPIVTTVPERSCSLTPGPTQQVPEDQSVSVTVDRNTITENPTITTTFNGGMGLGLVQRMQVIVIRSDCITEQGLQDAPVMGSSVTLMGTTGTDRVIVIITMDSGDQYTVIDNDYLFPQGM